MKPLKLIMNAFGPYGGKVEIDFSKLGHQGLYIITGATGAGKTTIFDAICFALYGETSGNIREVNDVRSDYAEDTDEAYVSLEFSHQGQLYRITRKPRQYRQAKRKVKGVSAKAMTQATALLEFLSDGQRKPLEKTSTVNKEIEDNILKITYEQFKQIVMIAQGEFQQALTTDTGERSEVMRKVFQTGAYKVLEGMLDEKKKVFSKKVEASNNEIKTYFTGISCDENSVYNDELKEKNNGVISAVAINIIEKLVNDIADEDKKLLQAESEKKKDADEQVESAVKGLQSAKDHNDNIEKLQELLQIKKSLNDEQEVNTEREAMVDTLKKVVYKVRPLYDDVNNQRRDIASVEANIQSNDVEIQNAKVAEKEAGKAEILAMEQQDQAKKLTEEAARLKSTNDSYERRDKLLKLVVVGEAAKTKAGEDLENVNDAIAKSEKKLAVAKKMEKECESTPTELFEVRTKQAQLGACLSHMNKNLRGKSRSLQEKRRLYEEQEKNSIEADIQLNKAQINFNTVNIELRCNRAGILAADLKAGQKCPVCGSTDHPELAHSSGTKFTDADLDRAQEALNKATAMSGNARLEKLNALNDYRNSVNEIVAKINDVIDNVHQSGEDGKNILDTINWHECAYLSDMSQEDISYEALDNNQRILEQELQRATDLESKIQEAVKVLTNKELDLSKKVDIVENARKVISECEDKLIQLKKDYQQALTNQTKISEELEKYRGELAGIGNLEYSSLAELKQQVKKRERDAKAITQNIEEKQKAHNQAKIDLEKTVVSGEMLKKQLVDLKGKLEKAREIYEAALVTNGFIDENSFLIYKDKSDRDIEHLQLLIDEYKKKVLENKTSIENIKKQVGDNTEIKALEGFTKALSDARAFQNRSGERLTVIKERIKKNKACWNKINDISGKVKTEMEKAAMYERLYTTVSGTKTGDNKNNGKMSLEEYVQAAHFERILDSANERMKQISGGAYELCRHDEGTAEQGKTIGGNARTSLNLDVLDTNTNKSRLARTLSGGESFMASLSLALGFSDEIMSRMGGISVDTMFIDEGFGTLDGNRLTDTMNMLTHLSHGDRMIGIISHNSKLEECIPNQIIVQKDNDKGSSLKISIDDEII